MLYLVYGRYKYYHKLRYGFWFADSLLNPFLFTTLCFLTLRQLSVLGKKLVDFWPLIEKKGKLRSYSLKAIFAHVL